MRLVQRNDLLNPVIRNAVIKLKNDGNIMLITLSFGMLLQGHLQKTDVNLAA